MVSLSVEQFNLSLSPKRPLLILAPSWLHVPEKLCVVPKQHRAAHPVRSPRAAGLTGAERGGRSCRGDEAAAG